MNRKNVVLLVALALVLGGSAAWAAPPTPVTITQVTNQQVLEGNTLTFTVTAITTKKVGGSTYYNIVFSTGNWPDGATLEPNPQSEGTRTATFTWTPGFNKAGTFPNVTITATAIHPNGDDKASASTVFSITVGNVNQPPELSPIGPKSVDEGQLLSFTVSASDPDGDTLTFAATHPGGLPNGANFDPASRTFPGRPILTRRATTR